MDTKKISIDGVEYEPGDRTGEALRIIIADNRGLTLVGKCLNPLTVTGDWLTIRDSRCVIRWGTREHLAELALGGPTDNTRLGAQRDCVVRTNNIVAVYDCDDKEWADA